MSRHVVIVGSGVIGLSIAWHAARQKLAVTLIDRGFFGAEASWASAGILPYTNPLTAQHPIELLAAMSYQLHSDWYPILSTQSGIDYEFEAAGTVHIARTRAEMASLIGLEQRCQEEQIPFRHLAQSELLADIPTLSELIEKNSSLTALKLLSDARLRSPRYLKALVKACRDMGVRLIEEAGDVRLVSEGVRIKAAETNLIGRVGGDDFVVAAGAWSHELLRPVGLELSFVPIRGQIAFFQLARMPFRPCVYDGGNYLVPRRDGGLLAGSTLEDVGFDKSTTEAAIEGLSQFASDLVPELGGRKPDRAWAGLRPATFDGFPYIGRTTQFENLLIAAGHFRAGILLAPVTAKIIGALLVGDPVGVDITPFRISRG